MKTTQHDNPVRKLSQLVDWKPYQAQNGDAAWLQRLSRLSSNRSAVLAALGPSGVGVGKGKPILDPAAVYLVGFTDFVHSSGRAISVGVPPSAQQMPLLLAATAVLADTLNDASGLTDARKGVLLVSPDLDLRSKYCSLTVDREALEIAHPGSRMRPDGTRIALTKAAGLSSGGVCFFLPAGPLPPSIKFKPGLVLLDLRYARWAPRSQDFAQWARTVAPNAGILALYTCGDRDTAQSLRRSGYADFPLDHNAIAEADSRWMSTAGEKDDGHLVDWSMARTPSYLDRSHRIVEIDRDETETALVNGVARLLQDHDNVDAPDLRRARWLLAIMQQLTVPVIWYERAARDMGRSTMRRMIGRLGSHSLSVPEGLGPVIQTLRLTFDQLYARLESDNPRARRLVQVLRECAGVESTLVLVRDKVMELATTNWFSVDALADADWLGRVTVHSCARFEAHLHEEFDVALVNGSLPRRYRWIVGSHLPRSVTFLCYAEESDVVQSQLDSFYADSRAQATAQTRDEVLSTVIALDRPSAGSNTTNMVRPLILIRPPRVTPAEDDSDKHAKFHTIEGGLRGLRAALEAATEEAATPSAPDTETPLSWCEDATDDELLPDDDVGVVSVGEADDVWCRVLTVNSRNNGVGRLFLQDDIPVEYVRLSLSTDIKKALPQNLRSGDVVLRVEDGRRSGLFDRIVELAERQPRMQMLGSYRNKWKVALTSLGQRYSDRTVIRYDQMLADLQSAGAPIETELALRWWIQGLVIGPEKAASIAAVGTVIGDEALVTGARQFDRAFRQIRGIRQGIGRRLSTAIRRSFDHLDLDARSTQGDELDETLGLPLDELLETIDLAEVIEVGARQMVAPQLSRRFMGEKA